MASSGFPYAYNQVNTSNKKRKFSIRNILLLVFSCLGIIALIFNLLKKGQSSVQKSNLDLNHPLVNKTLSVDRFFFKGGNYFNINHLLDKDDANSTNQKDTDLNLTIDEQHLKHFLEIVYKPINSAQFNFFDASEYSKSLREQINKIAEFSLKLSNKNLTPGLKNNETEMDYNVACSAVSIGNGFILTNDHCYDINYATFANESSVKIEFIASHPDNVTDLAIYRIMDKKYWNATGAPLNTNIPKKESIVFSGGNSCGYNYLFGKIGKIYSLVNDTFTIIDKSIIREQFTNEYARTVFSSQFIDTVLEILGILGDVQEFEIPHSLSLTNGDSGSALFDEAGRIIGVNSMMLCPESVLRCYYEREQYNICNDFEKSLNKYIEEKKNYGLCYKDHFYNFLNSCSSFIDSINFFSSIKNIFTNILGAKDLSQPLVFSADKRMKSLAINATKIIEIVNAVKAMPEGQDLNIQINNNPINSKINIDELSFLGPMNIPSKSR